MKNVWSVMLVILVLSCSPAIESPEALIKAMKDTYGKEYFKTFTFRQRTVSTLPDGSTREETWYESIRVPGALSIRFDPIDSGRGIIFVRDSLFMMHLGTVRMAQPMIHPLLVLGFDVYAADAAETVSKLTDLGFDMSTMHESTWQERPVYVVGAPAGDDSTKQFWIDKERLVFVRSLDVDPHTGIRMEVQFNNYERIDGAWVSPEVLFLRDGKVVTEEYYSDMKTNPDVDDREFDAANWMYVAE